MPAWLPMARTFMQNRYSWHVLQYSTTTCTPQKWSKIPSPSPVTKISQLSFPVTTRHCTHEPRTQKHLQDPLTGLRWGPYNQCIFCVFSHVEIQTANHFLSPKFWLLWFCKERNLIKRRHIFWSSIREMRTMFDKICQISLTSGKINGHCPLKFGDG
jgi:hypothetical protein